ncbi:MAG: MBL fold metallo-hydrolase [Bacteroidia bacterium]|nr:MBL fold metallo-hydrolase [Bacteroidia bacterium]MCF8427277.1 MBL fold metallo-hydrolase [Bacteroidia bacterium]MCF8447409.1 MBL fold metallo-hydrolase [Bacteroidia bacterium]
MLAILVVLIGIGIAAALILNQDKFGEMPSGNRLKRIEQSPNYRNGSFQNQHETPDLSEDATYYSVLKEFMFTKHQRKIPTDTVPSQKINLSTILPDEQILVWFGHSSYYMQIDGKKILMDPVLSGAASPIAFTTKAFIGTNNYSVSDLPDIDYLFLSHDHWDHIDYETLIALQPRVKQIITGLGTGAHLEKWGYSASQIIENDWYDSVDLDSGFHVTILPARHFSGRGIKRNKALWVSFALQTPTLKIYLGGDSGYDTHFAEIGEKHGPFDLAILENGQYDKSWKYIHMMPNEVLQASKDLKAKRLFPVHSSKFSLANHAWDEPLKRITELNKLEKLNLITPRIGEKVNLLDSTQTFTFWWEGLN